MSRPWIYALGVFALYALVVVGVPLFPGWLGRTLSAPFTLGMLLFLVLHTVPLMLAMLYLRSRSRESAAERSE